MYQILAISFEHHQLQFTLIDQARYSCKTVEIKGKCYVFGYVYHLFNKRCVLCSGETAYCTYFTGPLIANLIGEVIQHNGFRLHNVTHGYFEDHIHTLPDLMAAHGLQALNQLEFIILYRHLFQHETFELIGYDIGFRRDYVENLYTEAVQKVTDLSFFQS